MNLKKYLIDKVVVILINAAAILLLSFYLYAMGNETSAIAIIDFIWVIVIAVVFAVDYYNRKKYYRNIYRVLNELDKRYLIAEVIRPTHRLEDRLNHDILRLSNKSVIEDVNKVNSQLLEYREYIEAWIHDVKTPLTAVGLICENNKDENFRKIQAELEKINNLMEMVLYYARVDNANKDFIVKTTDIKELVINAVRQNKVYLIQNNMQVEVELEKTLVHTDEKWVMFILSQLIINCIKYKKDNKGIITFRMENGENKYSLVIEDNGIGIKKSELKRIFEKGFTGTNGRNSNKSTGIGLYLCKKVCDKLEIGITCESLENEYTRMVLTFPDSNHLILQ